MIDYLFRRNGIKKVRVWTPVRPFLYRAFKGTHASSTRILAWGVGGGEGIITLGIATIVCIENKPQCMTPLNLKEWRALTVCILLIPILKILELEERNKPSSVVLSLEKKLTLAV